MNMVRPPRFTGPCASVLALLVLASGCARSADDRPAPAVRPAAVHAEKVAYSTEALPVYATGVLHLKDEAKLSFKVGGIVAAVRVRVGDRVRRGDVLARLRTDEIDAEVVRAQASLDKARRDLQRLEKLREEKVATLENQQDARTAVEAADALVRIAEFNRDHAEIVAPADGVILQRLAEPDEMAESGHPVIVFGADTGGWIVRAGVAESDVLRLQVGDRAEVALDGASSPPVGARVTQISGAADPATRTTEVELGLERAPAGARSGFVVRATVHPHPVAERPVVPASALIEGAGDAAYLFLVMDNSSTARRLQVATAGIDGDRVFLRTELPRQAAVVVSGAEYLHDGSPVELLKR